MIPKFHEAHSPQWETSSNPRGALRQDLCMGPIVGGKKRSHRRPITSAELHAILQGVPAMMLPGFLGLLVLGPPVEFQLSPACFKPGVLLKRNLTCSQHGWLASAYGGIFSSWSLNIARCSLMFATGCPLEECPGSLTGSPEQLGEEVTIKRHCFRQFR